MFSHAPTSEDTFRLFSLQMIHRPLVLILHNETNTKHWRLVSPGLQNSLLVTLSQWQTIENMLVCCIPLFDQNKRLDYFLVTTCQKTINSQAGGFWVWSLFFLFLISCRVHWGHMTLCLMLSFLFCSQQEIIEIVSYAPPFKGWFLFHGVKNPRNTDVPMQDWKHLSISFNMLRQVGDNYLKKTKLGAVDIMVAGRAQTKTFLSAINTGLIKA